MEERVKMWDAVAWTVIIQFCPNRLEATFEKTEQSGGTVNSP